MRGRGTTDDAVGEQSVTQGVFTQTVQQLNGFDVVEPDDLDHLVQVRWLLGHRERAVEIRRRVVEGGAA